MGWFDGGNKHTGWKAGGPNGKPVTDKQAKDILAKADKKWQSGK